MNTQQLSNKLNGLTLQQAKDFIENVSGLRVQKILDVIPHIQSHYKVEGHKEINSLTVTRWDATSPVVKVSYCWSL